jgi:KDO2-lipid IV(A) lauroyltransferase
MRLKPVVDWLVYLVVRVLVCFIQTLSLEAGLRLSRSLGRILYTLDRRHAQVARQNLQHAFPGRYSPAELDRLVREVYVHFASIVIEMAHIPRRLRRTTWTNHVVVRNGDVPVRTILSGRPVILLTAHFGNWEIAGFAMGLFGFKPHSIARAMDNRHLERFIRDFRTRTGQEIIYKRGAFDQVAAVMQRGGLVGILSDQDAGQRGVFVEFFGRPASSHKGAALLALQHDAPICVGFARRLPGSLQYEVWVEGVVDPRDYRHRADPVRDIVQDCARATETAVRANPHQYFWLHRRWKHQPAEAETRRVA